MTYREVARKLAALGCTELPRTGGGSHRKWHHPATSRSTVVRPRGAAAFYRRRVGGGRMSPS